MSGFDLSHNTKVLENAVLKRFEEAHRKVLETLNSPGYSHIIKSVRSESYLSELEIEFVDGVDIKGQNVLQVLAHGGQIKKEDELIPVPPSDTIRRYLSTRK